MKNFARGNARDGLAKTSAAPLGGTFVMFMRIGRALAEDVTDLFNKGLVHEGGVFNLGKFLEQLALFFRQRLRRDQSYSDEQIALASTAERRHAVRFQTKYSSRLRARGNFQIFFAVECLNLDLGAKSRLCKRNGYG